MPCPIWEECPKKSCIEVSICTNAEYWANYWKKRVEETKCKDKKYVRERKRIRYFESDLCVKRGSWCDKKEACDILGQCIIKHPKIAANPALMNALRGPLTPAAIVKIIREHDPEAFDSFYPKKKKVQK